MLSTQQKVCHQPINPSMTAAPIEFVDPFEGVLIRSVVISTRLCGGWRRPPSRLMADRQARTRGGTGCRSHTPVPVGIPTEQSICSKQVDLMPHTWGAQ